MNMTGESPAERSSRFEKILKPERVLEIAWHRAKLCLVHRPGDVYIQTHCAQCMQRTTCMRQQRGLGISDENLLHWVHHSLATLHNAFETKV